MRVKTAFGTVSLISIHTVQNLSIQFMLFNCKQLFTDRLLMQCMFVTQKATEGYTQANGICRCIQEKKKTCESTVDFVMGDS